MSEKTDDGHFFDPDEAGEKVLFEMAKRKLKPPSEVENEEDDTSNCRPS